MDSPASSLSASRTETLPTELSWADFGNWLIRRNPLYLFSAAAMALAARLLLVDPSTCAGDFAHILLTLGVIQLYEISVTAAVLLLHRVRRSPEDLPSLFLVGTIFWTAPLAATAEMTAQHGTLGIVLSIAVAILAVAEFETVRRIVNLPISAHGRAAGFSTLALIAFLPAFLLPSDATGRANEWALLAGWWLAAAILLLLAAAARAASLAVSIAPADPAGGADSVAAVRTHTARRELLWLLLLTLISGVQLIGMNHAFYLHATSAYAAPLLALLALVLVESRGLLRDAAPIAPVGVWVLPLVAMALSLSGLDPKYVEPHAHWLVARPLAATGLLAGLVWWFAYRRGWGGIFLHFGSGAIASAVVVLVASYCGAALPDSQTIPSETQTAAGDERLRLSIAAFTAAAYFATCAALRRSRADGVLALALLAGGVLIATWQLVSADRAIAAITIYWFWFIALHVVTPRPRLFSLALAVAYGVLFTIGLDSHAPSRMWIWLHAPLMPLVLAGLWYFTRSRDYAMLACVATGIPLGYLSIRGVAQIRPSAGAIAAGSAFVLLIAGMCVSWFKGSRGSTFRAPNATENPKAP
jgi:hypothetical protein